MAQYISTPLVGKPMSGRARIINPMTTKEREEQIDAIEEGDIIITPNLDLDYVLAFSKANGIITDRGGRLSHTAVIARERTFPIVVLENALNLIPNGAWVRSSGNIITVEEQDA